jgi:hypothetical protein
MPFSKLPSKKPKFGGKPKAFSKPPNPTANKEYGGLPPKKASDASSDFDQSQGNVERGFKQNTPRKATAASGFKAMSAPGNSDFGLIGASAPAPMTPVGKKKPRKISF